MSERMKHICRVCGADITEKGMQVGGAMWCLEHGLEMMQNIRSCTVTVWGVELNLPGTFTQKRETEEEIEDLVQETFEWVGEKGIEEFLDRWDDFEKWLRRAELNDL